MLTGKYMTVTEPISRNFPESLKSCLPESPDGVLHLVTATKAQNRSMKVFSVVTAGGAGGRHYKPDARASRACIFIKSAQLAKVELPVTVASAKTADQENQPFFRDESPRSISMTSETWFFSNRFINPSVPFFSFKSISPWNSG